MSDKSIFGFSIGDVVIIENNKDESYKVVGIMYHPVIDGDAYIRMHSMLRSNESVIICGSVEYIKNTLSVFTKVRYNNKGWR